MFLYKKYNELTLLSQKKYVKMDLVKKIPGEEDIPLIVKEL